MAKVFCTHCGAANPEESAFCEQCGQALMKPQEVEQDQAGKEGSYRGQPAKKNSGKKWIIPVVILLVLALAGGGAYMYHKQQEAHLLVFIQRKTSLYLYLQILHMKTLFRME